MGFAGIRPGSLLLILLIVVLLFGTGRLRSIGKDLGEMAKSFREGLNEFDKGKQPEVTLVQNEEKNAQKSPSEDLKQNNPS